MILTYRNFGNVDLWGADVVRIDKGHTEGLEPRVTEAIVKMMVDAKGGKARGAD